MSFGQCPYCEGGLELLPSSHPEFVQAQHTSDGTRKWFICKSCTGVWCYDKILKSWFMSPQTYTDFVEQGKIPDVLESG